MHATTLPYGIVTAPGQRYHPAIVAQAIATLGELYPGRLWVALGSGLTERVDHLAGIGVTCIWLMPYYPTPERDDGYDVIDFCGVD